MVRAHSYLPERTFEPTPTTPNANDPPGPCHERVVREDSRRRQSTGIKQLTMSPSEIWPTSSGVSGLMRSW